MSYDIQAACDAAKQRLARTLERSIGQHKRAIRAGFAQARAAVEPAIVSAPAQRRIPMISEGTASAQRIQYGRVMYEACAASDCDPITGECLGHCMGAMQ